MTSAWKSSMLITAADGRGPRLRTRPGGRAGQWPLPELGGRVWLGPPPAIDPAWRVDRRRGTGLRPAPRTFASQPVVARRSVTLLLVAAEGHGMDRIRQDAKGGRTTSHADGRSTRPNVADLLDQPLTTAATGVSRPRRVPRASRHRRLAPGAAPSSGRRRPCGSAACRGRRRPRRCRRRPRSWTTSPARRCSSACPSSPYRAR